MRKAFDSYRDGKVLPYIEQAHSEGNNIIIVYIGSLSNSYDIPLVIDAIKKLNGSIQVKLLVMGDGDLRSKFEEYARNSGIDYFFSGAVPYPEMVANLVKCDVAVNPIKPGSAGSVINKVGDYAMAGLPVINTQESLEYRELLEKYHAGISCNTVDEIAQAIKSFHDDRHLLESSAEGAGKLSENFDRMNSYKKIVNVIQS